MAIFDKTRQTQPTSTEQEDLNAAKARDEKMKKRQKTDIGAQYPEDPNGSHEYPREKSEGPDQVR